MPKRVHTVVISVQHSENISLADLRADVMEKVIKVVIPEKYLDERTVYHINPCGEFVRGGPQVRIAQHLFFAIPTTTKRTRSFTVESPFIPPAVGSSVPHTAYVPH